MSQPGGKHDKLHQSLRNIKSLMRYKVQLKLCFCCSLRVLEPIYQPVQQQNRQKVGLINAVTYCWERSLYSSVCDSHICLLWCSKRTDYQSSAEPSEGHICTIRWHYGSQFVWGHAQQRAESSSHDASARGCWVCPWCTEKAGWIFNSEFKSFKRANIECTIVHWVRSKSILPGGPRPLSV